MEKTIDNLKDIKIEVNGRELRIFERFPDFSPFVGDKYNSGESKKILLIWESYYDTKKPARDIIKCTDKWYFEAQPNEIIQLFGDKTNDYERPWNFASKMHKDGRDRLFKWRKGKQTKIKNPTFQNVETVLNEITKEQDKNSFKYCAGYNYYLRPALNSSSVKSDPLDEKVAIETLKAVIRELNPTTVIFFSKKAEASFKPYREEFESVKFKAFVHPASAWWNRKSGKSQKSGKQRFEEFIEKLYQ